ncbi:nicotinate-nucleotide adenylyltransferase [Lachnospiraceae bacterium]|nr:nicotinate-nucleotide adenylyltransferase [Lachnospiraceae bacterium]
MSDKKTEHPLKVGILGGTFNPIHIGHLILAEQARSEFNLDQVLIMPSGISYFKSDINVLPAETRYEMVKAACKDNPCFKASDFEIKRAGNTYTSETLRDLTIENPDIHYYFIIGADTLLQMDTWYKPEILFSSCTILCAVRDKITSEELESKKAEYIDRFNADIEFLHTTDLEISSKMLRHMVAEGRSIRYYVTDEVLRYINEHDLYRE